MVESANIIQIKTFHIIMKKFTHKNLLGLLKSKAVLAISSSLILTSCVIQTGGYSETDGVYYDPNRDTLPEGTVMNSGNRVGEYLSLIHI